MHPVEAYLADAWDPARWRDVTVLVGVSGGPDSVALVRAASSLHAGGAGRLIVVHYNHALRGAASAADEQFVVELSRHLQLECRVGRAATSPSEAHSAAASSADAATAVESTAVVSEERSRASRYEFLRDTARACGARYVAVAHTADDQAETILHHVLRGTGLAGLSGMPAARELAPGIALVRPLLRVRREEIIAYLAQLGQLFRVDDSNADVCYTRNRLRHELLPQLAEDYNPRVVEALVRLGTLAGEAQALIESQAADLAVRATVDASSALVVIDSTVLAAAPRALQREALVALWRAQGWPLQGMGYDEWERLAALVSADWPIGTSIKEVLPGAVCAERYGDRLTLSRRTLE